jgi:hypothetical protein
MYQHDDTERRTMTAEQRSREIARVLAAGLRRLHERRILSVLGGENPEPEKSPKSIQSCLALPPKTVLSVHRS